MMGMKLAAALLLGVIAVLALEQAPSVDPMLGTPGTVRLTAVPSPARINPHAIQGVHLAMAR